MNNSSLNMIYCSKYLALKIKNTEYFKAVDSQWLCGGDLALPVKVEVVFTVKLQIAPST